MSGLVEEYLRLKERVPQGDSVKTSLTLDKTNFNRFKVLCKRRGILPSKMVDLFIADICHEYGDD